MEAEVFDGFLAMGDLRADDEEAEGRGVESDDIGGAGVIEVFLMEASAFAGGDEVDLETGEFRGPLAGQEPEGTERARLKFPQPEPVPALMIVQQDLRQSVPCFPGVLCLSFLWGIRCGHGACFSVMR